MNFVGLHYIRLQWLTQRGLWGSNSNCVYAYKHTVPILPLAVKFYFLHGSLYPTGEGGSVPPLARPPLENSWICAFKPFHCKILLSWMCMRRCPFLMSSIHVSLSGEDVGFVSRNYPDLPDLWLTGNHFCG